jgi:hypothetical protein
MQPNEQIPSQLPPDPNSLPVQPVRRTVIQPLSSEEEIRQAAASSGAPARPSEPGVNPAGDYSSETTEYESTAYQNTYEGSLITEPIHRTNQAPLPYGVPKIPAPDVTTRPKRSVAKAVGITFGVLFIGVLGVAGWLFLPNRVSAGDLVMENVGQSTYLRPKQWSQIAIGVSGYGNMASQDGKSTALVSVSEFPLTSSQVTSGSEESYSRQRKLIMEQLSESTLTSMMGANTSMGCQAGTSTVAKNEDTSKNDSTVGLVQITASCKKGSGPVTMKMRLVAGMNDERVRMVIVGASDLDWVKNGKAFQRMLDGVEERKTT